MDSTWRKESADSTSGEWKKGHINIRYSQNRQRILSILMSWWGPVVLETQFCWRARCPPPATALTPIGPPIWISHFDPHPLSQFRQQQATSTPDGGWDWHQPFHTRHQAEHITWGKSGDVWTANENCKVNILLRNLKKFNSVFVYVVVWFPHPIAFSLTTVVDLLRPLYGYIDSVMIIIGSPAE